MTLREEVSKMKSRYDNGVFIGDEDWNRIISAADGMDLYYGAPERVDPEKNKNLVSALLVIDSPVTTNHHGVIPEVFLYTRISSDRAKVAIRLLGKSIVGAFMGMRPWMGDVLQCVGKMTSSMADDEMVVLVTDFVRVKDGKGISCIAEPDRTVRRKETQEDEDDA